MRVRWRRGAKSLLVLFCLLLIGCLYIFVGNNFSTNIPYTPKIFKSSSVEEAKLSENLGFLKSLDINHDTYLTRLKRFNDYVESEPSRQGPGEQGRGVTLHGEEEKLAKAEFPQEAFNRRASDKVSLDRSLSDIRMKECSALLYPEDLPTASVIIIFHNEAWSSLMRTAHSVVNRSPPRYLREVILFDDASYKDHLAKHLDDYVAKTWPDGIVRIVRKDTRQGLIRARLEGAKAAVGDVIIFLDSHCEATKGWLEPLLARIKENRQVSLFPQIDSIDANTIAYHGFSGPPTNIGTFWWSLHFTWWMIPDFERRRRSRDTDPVRSPTMPGGLFAMDRKYFFELGSYDYGMEIWGGENLELSFRVWMCGGLLEIIPCSHVGHIFRASHPYTFPNHKDYHGINSKRLAEVWMDDYKRLFYMHRKDLLTMDAGDYSDRISLRKKLKCHNFQWYVDNVVPMKFIPDRNVSAYGYLRNPSSNLCIDLLGQNEFDRGYLNAGLYSCQNGASGAQIFSHAKGTNQLRREWGCLTVNQASDQVKFLTCSEVTDARQVWSHTRGGEVKNQMTEKCLDTHGLKNMDTVRVSTCRNSPTQRWEFENYS